jgi:predicted Zn-dependent protease
MALFLKRMSQGAAGRLSFETERPLMKRSVSFCRGIFLAILLCCLAAPQVPALTLEEERKLGDQVVREVAAKFTLIQDPVLLTYLNQLGQETLRAAGPQPYPFRFYLLKDSQLNAFSVPGGHIFISTGIVEIMDSEAELGGLIGHEIAHITAHHISRRMEKEKKISLATMAIALASVFAGDPRITSAAIAGSMATGLSISLKYSREDEEEADNLGFKYMSKTGFDPKGMVDLLDKLRRWGSFGPEGIPIYMQTHPSTGDRIASMEFLRQRYLDQGPWRRSNSENFHRFQTIILAKYGDVQKTRNRFLVWARDPGMRFWVQYGQAWLYVREGNYEKAVEAFEATLALKPHDPDLFRDLGEAYLSKGQIDQALQKLGQAAILRPGDPSTAFLLGRAYQGKGEYALALDNLNRALALRPDDGEIHHSLGVVYGNLNDLARAHYHFGKSFQIKGEVAKATFHFQTALKYGGGDQKTKELIEGELKTLKEKNKAMNP